MSWGQKDFRVQLFPDRSRAVTDAALAATEILVLPGELTGEANPAQIVEPNGIGFTRIMDQPG